MGRLKMRLDYYYESLFVGRSVNSDVTEVHNDKACDRSWIGSLFTADKFYATYNSTDNKKFSDRLDEIASEREYAQNKIAIDAKLGQELKFSEVSYSAAFLKDVSQFKMFQAVRGKLFETLNTVVCLGNVEGNLVDQYLNAYQDLLIIVLNRLADCRVEHEKTEIKQFLSKFMLIDCIKDYTENNIYISWVNPLMLL